MDNSEFYDFENRRYIVPTLSRDEQLDFVENLRNMVRDDTARINTQTQRLGTNISPNLGGLAGSGGYFAQRHQTTPVEAQVKTLKSAAQSKAMTDLMNNYSNQVMNRYNQAYRSANKRKAADDDSTMENLLKLLTNGGGGGDDGRQQVSTTDWQNQLNKLNQEANGDLYYLTLRPPYKNPVKIYLNNLNSIDDLTGVVQKLGVGSHGQTKTLNGTEYMYLEGGQQGPGWYRVGMIVPTNYGE